MGEAPLESIDDVGIELTLEESEEEDKGRDKKPAAADDDVPDIGQGSDDKIPALFWVTSSWSKVTQFLAKPEAMFCCVCL